MNSLLPETFKQMLNNPPARVTEEKMPALGGLQFRDLRLFIPDPKPHLSERRVSSATFL